jgi:hypothetical protein
LVDSGMKNTELGYSVIVNWSGRVLLAAVPISLDRKRSRVNPLIPRMPAVEGVAGDGAEAIEVFVEGAEGHDAVARHVLGLVGVGRDPGLRLLLLGVGRGVVIDLRQHVVERRRPREDQRRLLVQRVDDMSVGGAEVVGRARQVGGAAQQAEMERTPLLPDRCQVDPGAVGRPGLVDSVSDWKVCSPRIRST